MDDFLIEVLSAVYKRKQAHLNTTDYCKYDNQILALFTSVILGGINQDTEGETNNLKQKLEK